MPDQPDQDSPSRRAAGSTLSPGDILSSRYRILAYIGEGGMGLVYKAHDAALDEVVAIKLLRPQLLEDPRMRQRFLSEIKLARRVTHKNVCRIHDYGEDGGLGYISMQFVEGVELKTLIQQSPRLSATETCDIAIQLADGLQAIHDAGIIHRDFKPANVVVDRDGDPRLMDFGIAKLWESRTSPDLTMQGIVGTPQYMSPEQASGEAVDPRTDIYAMGIVLFELFTGTRPFTGENIASILHKQLHDPPPLDGAAAAIPAAIKPIIQRALEKRREDRFQTADELKEALSAARATLAPETSAPERRDTRRLLWYSIAAASLLIVAIVGALISTSRFSTQREPDPPPQDRSTTRTPSTPATNSIETPNAHGAPPPQPPPSPSPMPSCEDGDTAACRTACDNGTSTACTQLGLQYNRGTEAIPRDLAAAAMYYGRGCDGGDPAGCNNLGTLYEFGALGLQGDRAKALTLYDRACTAGHLEACANLAALYLKTPNATPAQKLRAHDLLQKACSAGIPRACTGLSH